MMSNRFQNLKSKLSQKKKTQGLGFWNVLQFLFWLYMELKFFFRSYILSKEKAIKIKYYRSHGKHLDLRRVASFNEKIQWMKLFEENPLQTTCSDKFGVRDYVKDKIGDKYLVPLVFETKNVSDLHPENFPDYPVIIKTNHDSSGGG